MEYLSALLGTAQKSLDFPKGAHLQPHVRGGRVELQVLHSLHVKMCPLDATKIEVC